MKGKWIRIQEVLAVSGVETGIVECLTDGWSKGNPVVRLPFHLPSISKEREREKEVILGWNDT